MSIRPSASSSTVNVNARVHTSPEKEKQPAASPKLFSNDFTDRELTAQRKEYIKSLVVGCFSMVILMFGVFSIYWGALWKVPDHKLPGWVVVRAFPTTRLERVSHHFDRISMDPQSAVTSLALS